MNDQLKKHIVTIGDDVYTLLSDESEETVLQAVRMLDELMSTIMLQSSVSDKKKIAVLAALQIALQLKNLEQQMQSLEQLSNAIDSEMHQPL